MKYYITRKLTIDFDEALEKVTQELQNEGFGVLTDIDVQATLKKKLEIDFRRYRILGACNAPFAYKTLKADDKIGTLLPCNVVVQEHEAGKVEVSMINPLLFSDIIDNEEIGVIAEAVYTRLNNVLEKL